jgi:hypothetical protein
MKGKAYADEFKEQLLREVDETGNMTLVAMNRISSGGQYKWVISPDFVF